jgi:hypothetical protein
MFNNNNNRRIYPAFKGTEEARIMKGFMHLPYEEREKYKHNPATWITDYRKEHPNAFCQHCSKHSGSG